MPTPSWGTNLIFPFQIIEALGAGTEWNTDHVMSIGAEVFNSRWDDSRWHFSLSGAKVLFTEMDIWDAFVEATRGSFQPFLFRANSSRFVITNENIGTGNGTLTAFQLIKTRSIQGRDSVETIKYPWDNYPDIMLATGQIALKTEYVQVSVAGVAKTYGTDYTVNRDTGIVTFAAAPTGAITASCKFMKLVHGIDLNMLNSTGGDSWDFSQTAELIGVFDE